MATSYVAVGTVVYMIADNLTCPPQKATAEALWRLHQVDGSERVSGGHVWPCPLDGLNGNHGLAHVVPTGRPGDPKGLPDDVLKVRVHAAMRAQPAAKEKPRARCWGAHKRGAQIWEKILLPSFLH